QADERSEAEAEKTLKLFMEKLDVDEEVALILVQEGFSSIEEVAYVPIAEMIAIEEFDEGIAQELQSRARDIMLQKEIASEEGLSDAPPAEDLLEVEGMDEELARSLARRGVITREDLAELAIDDLVELTDIERERAGPLIMAARAVWFENESQAN
ncbi:MAG: helix-hairpin-helix domain-containing protein, partial [Gammaproteobacteria bacterium]|nr:helix-hairpin-helix domain-containing protein [Gammaproteobacteria bacterium]